jgi:hypothetical protein
MILQTKLRDYYPMAVGIASAEVEPELGDQTVTVVVQLRAQIIRMPFIDM